MSPEKDFYEPGDPRSFGKPIPEPSLEEINKFVEDHDPYTNPEAFLKLSEGRDESVNAVLKIIARDRFFSSFPSLEKGGEFVLKHLPSIAKEYGLGETAKNVLEKTPIFYHEILKGLWEDNEQVEIGGLETMFISMDKPPENRSYEYLGEKIGRTIRKSFQKDRSYKTQAFFGWIGRQVMKKVCPGTDFSLDRHNLRVEEEKKETKELFQNLIKKVELGIEEELTLEKGYKFFSNLYWQMPSLGGAGTPLEFYYTNNLALGVEVSDYLPSRPDSRNSFEKFWEQWQEMTQKIEQKVTFRLPWEEGHWFFGGKKEDGQQATYETWIEFLQDLVSSKKIGRGEERYYDGLVKLLKEYKTEKIADLPKRKVIKWCQRAEFEEEERHQNWFFHYLKRNYEHVFKEMISTPKKMALVTQEELLPKWYEMLRFTVEEGLKDVAKNAENFKTTYFRFIKNKPVAEGYALAQEHIEEIMTNLPEIIKLPEEEIHKRYLSEEAKILNDEDDYGQNSIMDEDGILEEEIGEKSSYPSHNELEKMDEETRKHWALLRYGDNFKLYKKMQSFDFTMEQGILGVNPLFYGFEQSDRYAEAFLRGQKAFEKFYQLEQIKAPTKREGKRIEELKSGIFFLPQNPDDLLRNADLHIERLKKLEETPQIKKRIEVLEEVKEIIKEVRQKGLF